MARDLDSNPQPLDVNLSASTADDDQLEVKISRSNKKINYREFRLIFSSSRTDPKTLVSRIGEKSADTNPELSRSLVGTFGCRCRFPESAKFQFHSKKK